LPPGSYTVTTIYNGDAAYVASTNVFTQTIDQAVSALAVVSSSSSSVYGQSNVTITAMVSNTSAGSSAIPAGTVQFQINGSPLGGAVALSGGSASLVLPANLSVDTYTVTADYNGNTDFIGSTNALTQVVGDADSAVALVSSANPSVFGATGAAFTATVSDSSALSSGVPTGTVQFATNGVAFGGAVTLSGGMAGSPVLSAALLPGNYTVTAVYSGDANYAGSNSTITQTNNPAASALVIASAANPSVYGQSNVIFTATLSDNSGGSSGIPSGSVQFKINGAPFGSAATLIGGVATSLALPVNFVAAHYTVTAAYTGDADFAGTTNSFIQTNSLANSAVVVVSSANPWAYGEAGPAFTATVSDSSAHSTGTPTGTVQFETNGVAFGGVVSLSGGIASSPALSGSLSAGSYTVTAVYAGDQNFNPSSGTLAGGLAVLGPLQFTGISVMGTTLTITAKNGEPNGTFVLWQSPNLALPLAQWTPVLTNTFNNRGNLNLSTNIVTPGSLHEFYQLSQ